MRTEKFNLCKSTKKLLTLITLLTLGVGQMWANYAYLDLTSFTSWYDGSAAFRVDKNGGGNVDSYSEVKSGGSGTGVWRFNIGDYTGAVTYKRMNSGRTEQWNYYNGSISETQNVAHITDWNSGSMRTSFVINYIHGTNYVYFDNSVSQFPNNIYFIIGKDYSPSGSSSVYSKAYKMSKVSNTNNLWYVSVSDTWEDATYFAIVADDAASITAGSWGSSSLGTTNKGDKGYTAAYKTVYNMEGGSYLITTASSGNNKAMTITYKDGYSALNTQHTLNQTLSTNGGDSYSASTKSISSALSISSKKMNGNGSSTNSSGSISSGSSSTTCDAARTATVSFSVTAKTGYTFVGWYESSTQKSTSTTWSYTDAASSRTITARFKAVQSTITLAKNDGTGTSVTQTATYGETAASRSSARPTRTGYAFDGYYTAASGGNQVINKNGDWNSNVSGFTDSNGKWICTSAQTLHAHWLEVGWYLVGESDYVGGWDASAAYKFDNTNYKCTVTVADHGIYSGSSYLKEFKICKVQANTASAKNETLYGKYSGGTSPAQIGKENKTVTGLTSGAMDHAIKQELYYDGNYIYTLNTSGPDITVDVPVIDQLQIYSSSPSGDAAIGNHNWDGPMVSNEVSKTITLSASTTYQFKGVYDSEFYSKTSGSITRASNSLSGLTKTGSEGNMSITTDVAGSYTFTLNTSDKTMTVTYPTKYTVTTGRYPTAAASAPTISPTPTGGYLASGTTVTFTKQSANTGYSWKEWNTGSTGGGTKLGTGNTYSTTLSGNLAAYAIYTENKSTITVSAGTGGTVSKGSGSHSLGVATTVAIDATPSTGYSWSTWTISGNASLASSATTRSNIAKADGTNGGSGTITATFTPNHYDVILDVNGGSGDNQTVDATFAAAMPTVQKGGSTPIATRSRIGYNFDGYWATNTGTGTQYYTSALASNHNWDVATNETHIYAKWNAKQSAITFDYQTSAAGYYSSGSITDDDEQVGTYDQAMTALTGTMPSAKNGYAFMGFYDAVSGGGTKYYNADGSSAHTWDKNTDSGTTLYAYYKKAEITGITFDPGTIVENNSTVNVTAVISPTPVAPTTVCWRVLYDNGSTLDPQPEFTPANAQGNSVSFTAPNASGMYKVEAKLHTGIECGGDELDTEVADFQVAGSHTVTVAYKHSGTDIAASTSVTGRPLDWSDPITAPDIFGYTFSSWSAGDGITITDDDGATSGTSSSSATIKIKATYNGTLTANYTPKSLIYFKNTLGWSSVYVNFYTGESGYWDSKGSGNKSVTNRNKAMTRIGESDVWYYDYGAASITPTKWVSFTQDEQNGAGSGAQNFWASGTGEPVCYPARRADDLADKATETGFYSATPMFVPLAGQTPISLNESDGGKALYYNSGYWTKYLPGTGYTLEIYNAAGNSKLKEMDFTSADELMPMKAVADLEANTTYKFQIKRHGDVYLGNSSTMTYADHGQATPWEFSNIYPFKMCGLTTTAYGDYTFNFTYSAYHNESTGKDEYRMRLSVDYPVSDGDYRLVYTDNVHTNPHPSAIVQKENNGEAIVSFFVRHNQTPVLRIQQATVDGSGNITWNEYPNSGTPTNQITGAIASAIDATGVYNFNLSMNGSGALSVTSAEDYTGNFYIRTDAANSKWDNYRTDPDHLMTYSEYSITHGGYSHYYTHWVRYTDTGRKNVKFVIANDYSPCISDTLAREEATGTWANIATFMEEGGDLKRSANVRYMWNSATNAVSRAYIDGAQEDGSEFLLLLSDDSKIKQGETTKTQVTFSDNGNWIYEANVKAQPNAQIKLKSTWGEGTTIVQYFKGGADKYETLVGGSGSTFYDIRLLYDFKTNRLVAAYTPATGTIDSDIPINADVMFIREHQGDIAQLTFSGGSISEITTAYGVLRFNKWTINNKATAEPHSPLSPELSRFERDLFYISFPFRVNLEEVFGFGTYGTHWIIEEYDGAARAAKGFWADTQTFWRFITNRRGKFLEPNTGYILALDLDELGEGSSVWANTDQVELYFPSYGDMPTITSSSVTYNVPAHTCTINRGTAQGDRRIKDSHWNVISVPTYINTSNVTFANTDWITAGDGKLGPQFLYTVNWHDNSLSATSGVGYTYHAMHAYVVQYKDNITWTTSVSPATAPRRNPDYRGEYEFRLELTQDDQMIDQTFVKLSDDENVTSGFEFNYDMSKEFNKNKANIYTIVTSNIDGDLSITETAGNCLPLTDQTTVVPVGVSIPTAGDYTFSLPDGTEGIGVTLIDNQTGIRTRLNALDYTVNLTAGTHDGRFVLEISPIHNATTEVELINGANGANDEIGARKVLIDGILYIVKGDKLYDVRGTMIK